MQKLFCLFVATRFQCLRSHSDVLDGSVLYIQDNLEAASDNFDFVVYDIENVLPAHRAEIVVKPRLTRRKTALRVTDQPVAIGLDLLDASELKVIKKGNRTMTTDSGENVAITLPRMNV